MPETACDESGAIAPRWLSDRLEALQRGHGAAAATGLPATIVVYGYDQAVAALAAAVATRRRVRLKSPFCVAASLGPRVAKAMFEQASVEVPRAEATWMIDCGDAPGLALTALRAGAVEIEADLPAEALARVADIGRQLGAVIVQRCEEVGMLDLADVADPLARCREWLENMPHEAKVEPDGALSTPDDSLI